MTRLAWQVIGDQVLGDVLELLALTQADRELFQEELQRSERQYFEAFMHSTATVDNAAGETSSPSLRQLLGGNELVATDAMEQALHSEQIQRRALKEELERKDDELTRVKADAVARDNASQRQVLALKQQVKRLTARIARDQETASTTADLCMVQNKAPAAQTQKERAEQIIAEPKPRAGNKASRPLWQNLATQEVLEASRPPEDFPIPARHRGLITEVEALQSRVKELQASLNAVQGENDKLRRINDGHQRHGHRQLQEAREQIRQQEPQLNGAMRRINWLVEQKKVLETEASASVLYTQKLEKKLIEKDDEVQRLKKKLQNPNNLKAKKGGFSYWREVASPAASPEQPRELTCQQQMTKLHAPPEPVDPNVVAVGKAAPCVESA